MYKIILLILIPLLLVSCTNMEIDQDSNQVSHDKVVQMNYTQPEKTAVFAGGCFWCMESDFEKLLGVKEVISGYAGGHKDNPTYEEVSSGTTGHREVVQVVYDPEVISYDKLLEYFWTHVDPTDSVGQFCDKGEQYTTAIFYNDEDEKKQAEESKEKVKKALGTDIYTDIIKLDKFYPAEEYHQDYNKKNSVKYKYYRFTCGRDKSVEQVWGDVSLDLNKDASIKEFVRPDDEELKEELTPIQYKVTQKDGTETPFENEYWNNTDEGIYVDIVSGEVLFNSKDKFKSGTGWPSFTRPLVPENMVEHVDNTLFTKRTEVRSKLADSHLGHVFNDGPKPTGLRYCMNSAALRFVPKEDMEKEGYGQYLYLFE